MPLVDRLRALGRRMERIESLTRVTLFSLGVLLLIVSGYDLATPGASRLVLDLIGLALAAILLTVVFASIERSQEIISLTEDARPELTEASSPGEKGTKTRHSGPLNRSSGTIAGLLLIAGLGCSVFVIYTLWTRPAAWQDALPFWIASLALLIYCAAWIDRARAADVVLSPKAVDSSRQLISSRPLIVWAEIVGIVGIVLFAVFLRIYQLDSVPPGVFIDETNGGLDALAILNGAKVSPFATGWYEVPSGYMYLLAGYISLLGPTLLGLRLSGIVNGALTVLGTILLGRELFGRKAGLIAGILMAVSFWPLNMSRWGWVETMPPLAQVFAAWLLVRAFRKDSMLGYALAGLVLGLGMYSYLSIRLALLAIAIYLLYRVLLDRSYFKRALPGLVLVFTLWVVVFSPLAIHYYKNPQAFLNRSSEITIQRDIERAGGSINPLIENTKRHLLMFNVAGDSNGRHNVPGRPMLDPVFGALFVLGVFRGLLLARDHRFGLLLLWIPAILAGGIFSALGEGPQSFRTLGVMPAVAILAAEPLARLISAPTRLIDRAKGALISERIRQAVGILAALFALSALGYGASRNLVDYFVTFPQNGAVYLGFTPVETGVAKELNTASDLSSYYLGPRLYYFSPPRFFTSDRARPVKGQAPISVYNLFDSLDDLPLGAAERIGQSKYIGQDGLTVLWGLEWSSIDSVLREYYPNLLHEVVPLKIGGASYERANIPASDILQSGGLMARCRDNAAAAERVADPSRLPEGVCSRLDLTGSLYLPSTSNWTITAGGESEITLDGKPLRDINGSKPLAKGPHRLAATLGPSDRSNGLRLTWADGKTRPVAVPASAYFTFGSTPAATETGLLGRYYRNEAWQGEPAFSRIDRTILFNWEGEEPFVGAFSVSWRGEIEINTPGIHTFEALSDDGARLFIDNILVAEGLKPGGSNHFEGKLNLTAGKHRIKLDYFQRAGAKSVALSWAPPGKPLTLIPTEKLTPERPTP